MQRRNFLVGVGSASIGGSALLGSGAFTRVQSQRRTKIQVAHDSEAYLGLDRCHIDGEQAPNSSYIDFQDGHLAVEMSPDNPTDAGGQGVNSDSLSWFDNVFQICNNGKQSVCVWIQDSDDWPRVDDGEFEEDYSAYDGERRVHFYLGDDDETSIIGEENHVELDVGECVCVGLRTITKGLTEGDQLLSELDDEIVIHADADCPEVPIENDIPKEVVTDRPAISWASFCVETGTISADDINIEVTQIKADEEEFEPVQIEWTSTVEVSNVTLKGGTEFWHFDEGGFSGTATMGDGEGPEPQAGQAPQSPCPDGSCGVKFNWEGEEDGFVADDHQDTC